MLLYYFYLETFIYVIFKYILNSKNSSKNGINTHAFILNEIFFD